MKNFIPLLFLIAPLFALAFLLKCVDMHTYKENSGAKRTAGCVIISLFIILLSHLAAAVIGSRITMGGKLFEPLPGLLLILLLPLRCSHCFSYIRSGKKHLTEPGTQKKHSDSISQ